MEELILELKEQIIKALNLEEMTPEDIETDAPLFGEGLGLDSIDALELIVLLEKKYGIKLANPLLRARPSSRVWPPSQTLSARTERNNPLSAWTRT